MCNIHNACFCDITHWKGTSLKQNKTVVPQIVCFPCEIILNQQRQIPFSPKNNILCLQFGPFFYRVSCSVKEYSRPLKYVKHTHHPCRWEEASSKMQILVIQTFEWILLFLSCLLDVYILIVTMKNISLLCLLYFLKNFFLSLYNYIKNPWSCYSKLT